MKQGNKKRNRHKNFERRLTVSIAIINLIIALLSLVVKLIDLLES